MQKPPRPLLLPLLEIGSDSGIGEFIEADEPSSSYEGDNWVHSEYFSAEDIQDEIKAQYKRAMKEPTLEDLVHKKAILFLHGKPQTSHNAIGWSYTLT